MKNIGRILLFLTLLSTPALAGAQTDDPKDKLKKTEVKVNNLDVIYEEDEFKGVIIDTKNKKETESYLYQSPLYYEDTEEDDDEEEDDLSATFPMNDEGARSEDEILFEGFDTAAIHLPKLDVSTIAEPILVKLRDESRGEKFSWPTPWTARPSSHYGPRWRRFHYGLDLAQPTGEPIYAAFDGVVRISKYNRSYGNLVILHHANGLETYYAHMSKREVAVGQEVKSGDIIGLCGNTGRSFGSHLHFEIRYMGNALNPEDVVDCATHDLVNEVLTITPSSFRKVAKGGQTSGGSGGTSWYRVRKGDSLGKIARRHGTTVQRLCRLNGISRNTTLHPGQKLRVNGKAGKGSHVSNTSTGSKKSGGATHTVRKGETLYKIATANGTSVKKLCRLNGIRENSKLRPGQKLKVK